MLNTAFFGFHLLLATWIQRMPLVSDARALMHSFNIERPNQSTIVLVTVCTEGRRPLLAREPAVAAILSAWRAAETWRVGRYVIMPDHLHVFCSPAAVDAPALAGWVKWNRSGFTTVGDPRRGVLRESHSTGRGFGRGGDEAQPSNENRIIGGRRSGPPLTPPGLR